MERHTCLMIFIFIIQGGFSLYAVVTSLYAVTHLLYSVPSSLYVVHVVLQTVLFSLYAVLTAFYAVIFSLYAVLFLLCAVAYSLYAVLFYYARKLSRYTRCHFLARPFPVLRGAIFITRGGFFNIRGAFFHYIHGTSFSLYLKRGLLRMEAKMAATTRILQLISVQVI